MSCANCKVLTCIDDIIMYNLSLPINLFLLLLSVHSGYSKSMVKSTKGNQNHNVCESIPCIQAATELLANMDDRVDPCEDFYQFACGGFQAQYLAWDREIHVDTHLDNKMKPILRSLLTKHNQPSDLEVFRKMKRFYASCLNTTYLPEKGLQRLVELLDKYGGWPILIGPSWNETDFNWENITSKLMLEGINIASLLGLDLFFNYDLTITENYRVIQFRKPIILSTKRTVQDAYRILIEEVSSYLGANHQMVDDDIDGMMYFISEYSNIASEEYLYENNTEMPIGVKVDSTICNDMSPFDNSSSDMSEASTGRLVTIQDLYNISTEIDWLSYLETIFPIPINQSTPILLCIEQARLRNLVNFIVQTPKRIVANYLIWKVVYDLIEYVQEPALVKQKDIYRHSILTYRFIRKERRWIRCLRETSSFMLPALTALYSKLNFPLTEQEKVMEMFEMLRSSARKLIQNVTWLGNDTIQLLQENLDHIGSIIGYPSTLMDDEILQNYYKNITIQDDEYFLNVLQLRKFHHKTASQETQMTISRDDWMHMDSILYTNAYYYRFINAVVLPVSQLRGIYYASERLEALNYGSLASILGHELFHGLNDFGFVRYEHKMNWWKPEDTLAFRNRTKCMEKQYSKFSATPTTKVNGTQTLDENLADNSGLKVAYWAYQEHVARTGTEPRLIGMPQFTGDQLFWIAFANAWCSSTNVIMLSEFEPYRSHSPNNFRVIGAIQNMAEFAKDFQCPPNSPMNPTKKCAVW